MAKTYTAVPSVAAGDVYTAATYNTYTATNVSNLIVPPGVKANQSTLQAIGNASATLLTFDGADTYDTDSMHDPVTNNSRLTFNTAGVYVVTLRLATASAVSNILECFFSLNVGASRVFDDVRNPAAGNTFVWSFSYPFAAADYLTATIYHTTGSSVNTSPTNTWFSAQWIGQTS